MTDAWKEHLTTIGDDAVETGFQRLASSYKGNTQLLLALELERSGGNCPHCDRPFKERPAADQRFGKFRHFEPACDCYKRCERCGRWLVAERFLGISYCTGCDFGRPPQRERKGGQHRERRTAGKDAAAGG